MENTNKHRAIGEELERLILSGNLTGKLPRAQELAASYGVNVKTVGKALSRLVEQNLIQRKRCAGSFIVPPGERHEPLSLEVIYVGETEFALHPYFGEMWAGVLEGLRGLSYRTGFLQLEEDEFRGGVKTPYRNFTKVSGRLVTGTADVRQVEPLKRSDVPLVFMGVRPADNDVHAVHAECGDAMRKMIRFLQQSGVRTAGYIGPTATANAGNLHDVEKFYSFVAAAESCGMLESAFIVNTPPFASWGYGAMNTILSRGRPDAVFVGCDQLAPGVYRAAAEHRLRIPDDLSVIGCDGIDQELTPKLFSIRIPRREIGREAARMLLRLIRREDGPLRIVKAATLPEWEGSVRPLRRGAASACRSDRH